MEKELASMNVAGSVVPVDARAVPRKEKAVGLEVPRYFTTPGVDPADEIAWELRTAGITGEDGKMVFEQKNIEVPKSWSMLATNVVASKYFRGQPGTAERESSVRQLVGRVVNTITRWGEQGGYFKGTESKNAFHAELTHLLLRQKVAFNSPVWFNVGVEEHPQCSACFINSVEDSMDSILGLAKTEGMLFKYGSGTGSNLSPIRSSREVLKGGGTASGPVSFMKGFDAFAGVIKSGGKTRRAAKMVILNAEHPDVLEFIRCKVGEEKKAHVLIDAGYDPSFNGEAYSSVFFQNSNNRGGERFDRRQRFPREPAAADPSDDDHCSGKSGQEEHEQAEGIVDKSKRRFHLKEVPDRPGMGDGKRNPPDRAIVRRRNGVKQSEAAL